MNDALPNAKLSNSVKNGIKQTEKKEVSSKIRVKEKQDRATTEQVMDPRTRMILYKYINNGLLDSIDGCVSTGKEANVYYAPGFEGKEYAIKVYKTSILIFKDRDRYVSGEFRFRRGYSKSNPRKMIRVWAEKEMRNLKRLVACGINCPEPIAIRQNVLLMTFIGKAGWPAPRLKEVQLSQSKLQELYVDVLKMMRVMYNEAKLVHADLSEYNMLYFKGKIYFIDVSQSVEHDHPHALEFLRKDCQNIKDFFIKNGLETVLTTRELFEFITDINIQSNMVDAYLDKAMQLAVNRGPLSAKDEVDEEVFKQVYIPRTLKEIAHFEDHQQKMQQGDTDQLFYRTITGLNMDLTGTTNVPSFLQPEDEGSNDDENEQDDDEEDEESEDEEDVVMDDKVLSKMKIDQIAKTFDYSKISAEDLNKGNLPLPASTTTTTTNATLPVIANDEQSESTSEEENGSDAGEEGAVKVPVDLSQMPKKERKKYVKEMKREKRQGKVPKHLKKKAEKTKTKKPKK